MNICGRESGPQHQRSDASQPKKGLMVCGLSWNGNEGKFIDNPNGGAK
jgi:hypothetical protein